jgi:nucleotide-binding universal stress UspA family protein
MAQLFEKVLIPTDFSRHAEKIADCVGDIPGVKEVVLLHVLARDPLARVWSPGDEIKEAERKLSDVKKGLEDMGLKVKVRTESTLEGEVPGIIQRVADEEEISLIAMGARGKGILEEVLLGSVSTGVLRHGNKDLLIMRYRSLGSLEGEAFEKFCSRVFDKVLCPVDFSDAGMAAVNAIRDYRMANEAVLLNVITKGESEKQVEDSLRESKEKLDAIRDELVRSGVKATAIVLKVGPGVARTYGSGGMVESKPPAYALAGGAAEKILEVAEAEDISLIAMSSHGKGWLDQILIGSVVFDVARMARRPVLVVRAKKS